MKCLTAGVVALLLSSFAAIATAQSQEVAETRGTRVAWLDRCPHLPAATVAENNRSVLIGGLVAAIAPKLIEGAVDSAAEALKAAGTAKTFTTAARSGSYFYKVNDDADLVARNACLVIVRGVFREGTPSPAQLGWANGSPELSSLQRVAFLLEATIKPLHGSKFFQLEPVYLEQGGDFEDWSMFDRRDRDFLAAVALTLPGAAQPFGSAEFLLKDVTQGAIWKPGDARLRLATSLPIGFPAESGDATKAKSKLEGTLSPWLLAMDILTPASPASPKAPPLSSHDKLIDATKKFCKLLDDRNARSVEKLVVGDERCALELEEPRMDLEAATEAAHRSAKRVAWASNLCGTFTPAQPSTGVAPSCSNFASDAQVINSRQALASKQFTYLTTNLTLSETREGSKLALFLGNALSSAKPNVSSVLTEKWVAKTKAQQETEDTAARLAFNTVLLSDMQVTQAEESLGEALRVDDAKASEITAARIELLKAKIAANKARRSANLPILYAEAQ